LGKGKRKGSVELSQAKRGERGELNASVSLPNVNGTVTGSMRWSSQHEGRLKSAKLCSSYLSLLCKQGMLEEKAYAGL